MAAKRDLHDERAIAFFGTWMIIGLFLDGWAHQADKPETFFSPWHFILYSGFVAAVAYFTFRERILKKRSEPDPLTVAGLVVFIAGAVGDGIWHEIFGIEVDLDALLSPTHLALMIGGLMMLGIAYRSASRAEPREERADVSLVVTMTLCAALVLFFTQYLNAFWFSGLRSAPAGREELLEIYPIACVFAVNTVLCAFAFLLVRDWRTPPWTFTFAFGSIATGLVLLDGMDGPLLSIAFAALGGVAADAFASWLRPSRDNVRGARRFALLVPLVFWGLWFVGLHLQDGVRWAAELWTGTLILAAMEGLGLSLLVFPARAPVRVAVAD